MKCALKWAWVKAKKMDSTTEQADYDRALAAEMNADSSSPVIDLGGGDQTVRQRPWNNVARTGIGQ